MPKLDLGQKIALAEFIKREGSPATVPDTVTAGRATTALGFDVVASHVSTTRRALKIPGLRDEQHRDAARRRHAPPKQPGDVLMDAVAAVEKRLASAEHRITMLEQIINGGPIWRQNWSIGDAPTNPNGATR